MKTQTPHILILGGGYAGIQTALRLTGRAPHKAQITLVNASDTFVERIRLHQRAANQTLKQYSIPHLLRDKGITFKQAWVKALRPGQREVLVQTAAGEETLRYDILVYALGSTIDRDAVRGIREHAHVLTSEAVQSLREKLRNNGRLLVIGGGLTGIEASTELAEAYPQLKVTLATRGTLGENLSRKGQAYLRRTFARMGITVMENAHVTQIEAHQARLANGSALPFDACLWAGAFAVPSLPKDAGLDVNERGQILVDLQLRSLSHPDIYAVGDAAYCADVPTRMACATALPMGSHVGENIAAALNGKPQQDFRFGYVLQCISLGRSDALVQFVDLDDKPKESILTGRMGAFVKELICRYAVGTLINERTIPGFYQYPRPKKGNIDGHLRELSPDAVRNRL
jgi:NADH dehydrogenase FAD-containing subunit